MQRTYRSSDQPVRSSEPITPLIQQICTWAVVALLVIVVFWLLGARIVELYGQLALRSAGYI
jgi:hypothetical protein